MQQFPSIFNDVIGPVMRGPSSSHCAAAARIGLLARALMDNRIETVTVEFDTAGSLATTHESQGSDMGLLGGLLGLQPSDERLVSFREEILKAGVKVRFRTGAFGDAHPNTYRLTLENSRESHFILAISTGGGMIEVIEIDGHALSMRGDLHETLVFFKHNEEAIVRKAGELFQDACEIQILKRKEKGIVRISTRFPLAAQQVDALSMAADALAIRTLPSVLPVLTPKKIAVPFVSCDQMLAYNSDRKLSLAELAMVYESARGGIGRDDVLDKMVEIVGIMRSAVRTGLRGTRCSDRILGCQSTLYREKLESGQLLDAGILNRTILYVTALMENKSAMGVIVAAPTAGACGGLPGAVLAAADDMGCNEKQIALSMLAAGMIGVFISKESTFAAEVAGCQAECGAGSGMAAAALVTIMAGTTEQSVAAASMALQNSLGMVCDPVANRVEVPCLGKNVMAASNAISCANMALAGFDPVIPLDEVICTMDKVGKSIPCELRCTALGGLSVTRTSKEIQKKLESEKISP